MPSQTGHGLLVQPPASGALLRMHRVTSSTVLSLAKFHPQCLPCQARRVWRSLWVPLWASAILDCRHRPNLCTQSGSTLRRIGCSPCNYRAAAREASDMGTKREDPSRQPTDLDANNLKLLRHLLHLTLTATGTYAGRLAYVPRVIRPSFLSSQLVVLPTCLHKARHFNPHRTPNPDRIMCRPPTSL